MSLTVLISLANCFSQADDQLALPTHNFYALQQRSIEEALASSENVKDGWWRIALDTGADRGDCYAWRVIRCTDGIADTLLLPESWNTCEVDLLFLPPTIQFFHSVHCIVKQFSLRALPRDLRYIFLPHATTQSQSGKPTTFLNTADFPAKIEEVNLGLRTLYLTSIVIPSLPATLRLLYVSNGKHIQRAVVCNAGLPEGLEHVGIFLGSFSKKTTLVSASGGKVDSRIRAINIESREKESVRIFRYYEEYQAICDEIKER